MALAHVPLLNQNRNFILLCDYCLMIPSNQERVLMIGSSCTSHGTRPNVKISTVWFPSKTSASRSALMRHMLQVNVTLPLLSSYVLNVLIWHQKKSQTTIISFWIFLILLVQFLQNVRGRHARVKEFLVP